MMYYLCIVIPT